MWDRDHWGRLDISPTEPTDEHGGAYVSRFVGMRSGACVQWSGSLVCVFTGYRFGAACCLKCS